MRTGKHAAEGAPGTSPELTDALARLRELGYVPVMGTDIGHAFHEHPNIDLFDGRSPRPSHRGEAGVSPENVPTHNLAFQFNLNAQAN